MSKRLYLRFTSAKNLRPHIENDENLKPQKWRLKQNKQKYVLFLLQKHKTKSLLHKNEYNCQVNRYYREINWFDKSVIGFIQRRFAIF